MAEIDESKTAVKARTPPTEWAKILLVPICLAILGYFFDARSKARQDAESKDNLYAQLLSQREMSDSQLRTGMFKTTLDSFLKPPEKDDDPGAAVLKLELLAYNFHESLDLGPLFKDLNRKLSDRSLPANRNLTDAERALLLERLDSAARSLVAQQTVSLASQGQEWQVPPIFSDRIDPSKDVLDTRTRARRSGLVSGSVPAPRIQLSVLDMNPQTKAVHVILRADSGAGSTKVDVNFYVTTYDFPMMDNTRLADGSRVAVVVDDFSSGIANLSVVWFPALSAGLKDRINFDEALREMLRSRDLDQRADAAR